MADDAATLAAAVSDNTKTTAELAETVQSGLESLDEDILVLAKKVGAQDAFVTCPVRTYNIYMCL